MGTGSSRFNNDLSSCCKQNSLGGLSVNEQRWRIGSTRIMSAEIRRKD